MDLVRDIATARKSKKPGHELEKKIRDRSAKLGVIGMGYVGLPLSLEMAASGFQVTGIDIDGNKVELINAGKSHVLDVPNESLFSAIANKSLRATQSFAAVESFDTVSICVPTPLRKTKDPDLAYVIASVEAIHNHLKPGQLIVLESTTYPGTTREIVLPILEKSGLKAGKDFFLAYSPERVDPGNKIFNTSNIPKVIGGITPRCTELAVLLYRQFIDDVVPVSSTDTAEMVKLLENTFRSVNIALVNEMAIACHNFGIDVWEVIEAAKTKPFGYMPFYPGPGLGGHCVPIDPYYLIWKSKMNGFEPRLIELAGTINSQMPLYTVNRIGDALNSCRKSIKGSRILLLGVAYKGDTNDIRESPSLEVVKELQGKGALVSYSDPHVPSIPFDGKEMTSLPICAETLKSFDCIVLLTDHSNFDYATIAAYSPLLVDCRNALRSCRGTNIITF